VRPWWDRTSAMNRSLFLSLTALVAVGAPSCGSPRALWIPTGSWSSPPELPEARRRYKARVQELASISPRYGPVDVSVAALSAEATVFAATLRPYLFTSANLCDAHPVITRCLCADDLFMDLHARGELNKKDATYEYYWETVLKPLACKAYAGDASAEDRFLARFARFAHHVCLAAANTDCTVTITTSRGNGATIRYAKVPDADEDRFYTLAEPTMTITELERASYVFQSWRGATKTGEGCYDCTGEAVSIEIQEQ